MELHFSKDQAYKRKESDDKSFVKLEDVFKMFPREQVFHIEVKNQESDEASRKVVALIEKYRRFDTTIIGNMKDQYNQLIRKIDPRVAIIASWNDAFKAQLFFLTGLLPYVPINYESLSAPFPTRDYI